MGIEVIGEKASVAIIKFDTIDDKREFPKRLGEHGEEVKRKQ